jgi:hypothetical protein
MSSDQVASLKADHDEQQALTSDEITPLKDTISSLKTNPPHLLSPT